MKTLQKILLLLACCLFFQAVAPTTTSAQNSENKATVELPLVTSKDEAKTKIGKKVTVKGRFEAFKIDKMPKIGNRAKIVLSDNSALLLETGKKGLRKKCKMKKYVGKDVELTGTLIENARILEAGASPIVIVALALKDVSAPTLKTIPVPSK